MASVGREPDGKAGPINKAITDPKAASNTSKVGWTVTDSKPEPNTVDISGTVTNSKPTGKG